MFRRCYLGVAAVCLAVGMCLPAFAQGGATASGRQFTQSEHLMHQIIAAHFGITHQQVMDLHARGYSYEDIATAANIAARSGRPLSDVVTMRDRRMEWPAIASQYGIAAADLHRPFYRYTGPEPIVYEYNFYRVHTGIPVADYERYRRMGYTPRDIAMAYNVSRRTGRQPDEVFRMLDRGMTWDAVAREHNVALADIQMPEARVAGVRTEVGAAGMPGRTSFLPEARIDWSRRYELTPIEMKRLRAMGLRDREIWVAANGARMTGRDVDEFVRRIMRGQTVEQIAMDFNLPPDLLQKPDPLWQTPEWDRAVREGHLFPPMVGVTTGVTVETR